MSTGTRVVLGFVVFAAVVFAAFEIYGRRAIAHRGPDSPVLAAREAVQADNTVVGLVGGIGTFETIGIEPGSSDSAAAWLEVRVLGARDSGRMIAEMAIENGRWIVRNATFTLSDGTTIPVAGSAGR
ncbi:MAG TPA: hypothetical protein VEY33_09710 [Gemmatimonadota bacterium]|nr:hypothetical protein [Gemmatimonadota bacterium]